MTHWNNLKDDERYFIKMVLAFFAASDGIVLENLGLRFLGDVQLAEARAFYGFQIAMENIHSETYSLLIDTYIKDREEKTKLFEAMNNFSCIEKKAKWAQKWINDKRSSFATRLIAFACVEIHLAVVLYDLLVKKRGLLPGLTFSNELIRDKHYTQNLVLLYNKLEKKISKKRIQEIITEAVEIEKEFINEAIPCRMIGMNSTMMSQYIEFVADRLAVQLGNDKIYNSSNPFDWMEMISLKVKPIF